jgi:hypothetical protein
MLPLLFILLVIALGIIISLQIGEETSWFTYYTGGMIGLLLSALALEWWNKQKRKKEEEKT